MSTLRISSADSAHAIVALLERLSDLRDEVEIEADGVVVARLPAAALKDGTLQALADALGAAPRRDRSFADAIDVRHVEPRIPRDRLLN
jgi:hypothetical protein